MYDLFQQPPLPFSGSDLKKLGMALAEDSASQQVDDFPEKAFELLKRFIKIKSEFTCEDFRTWAKSEIGQVKDSRAYGGTFNRAAAKGLITPAGWSEAKNPKAHKCPKRLWKGI